MRWDSPFVLTLAGTLAIHTILLVGADALVITNPYRPPPPPAPRIDLVNVELPPVIKPPPPPIPQPEVAPVAPPPVDEPVKQRPRTVRRAATTPQPTTTETPPTTQVPTETAPGGDQIVALDDAPPAATGVPVGVGKRTTGRVGRGGSGGGTGAGSGTGAGEVEAPVSVATIKTRAMPRGDYGFFDAGRDYPPEARQLGIEGVIRVRLIVDTTGKVTRAVLLNRLGHGLDELALSRAKQIQFDPAKDTDDKPVTSVVVWTFNMTLPT